MKSQPYRIGPHPKADRKPCRCGLPGVAKPPAGASETPQRGPHLRRRAQTRVRPGPLVTMRTLLRGAPGLCPRPASEGAPSLFPGWENLSGGSGDPECSALKRLTLLHVHHG
jgi:hypothetical protein